MTGANNSDGPTAGPWRARSKAGEHWIENDARQFVGDCSHTGWKPHNIDMAAAAPTLYQALHEVLYDLPRQGLGRTQHIMQARAIGDPALAYAKQPDQNREGMISIASAQNLESLTRHLARHLADCGNLGDFIDMLTDELSKSGIDLTEELSHHWAAQAAEEMRQQQESER